MKKNKIVNYLDMIARAAEEERKESDEEVVMPEPEGEKVVDYLAVSEAWKKMRDRAKKEIKDQQSAGLRCSG